MWGSPGESWGLGLKKPQLRLFKTHFKQNLILEIRILEAWQQGGLELEGEQHSCQVQERVGRLGEEPQGRFSSLDAALRRWQN